MERTYGKTVYATFIRFLEVKKLDVYIIKKFLVTYFFVVLMLMLVITVIDITEKMEDFMKHDLSPGFVLVE